MTRLDPATLDRAFTSLDPATTTETAKSPQARALFDRIVSQPSATPRPRPSTNRTARRLAVIGVAAAAAGAFLVAPEFFGGSTPPAWSATPGGIPAPEITAAEAACAEKANDLLDDESDNFAAARHGPLAVRITDARGDLVLVSMSDDASEFTCFVREGDVIDMGAGIAGAGSTPEPEVGPDEVQPWGGGIHGTETGPLSNLTGKVGSDVVAVQVDTVAKGLVEATVRDGWFAAWWPGDETAGDPEEHLHRGFTLTLRDGTTRVVPVDGMTGR